MNTIDFEKSGGLVPAVIQDAATGKVLMLGYMNDEALKKTRRTGWVHFWSRSRRQLWMKGETSGNRLRMRAVLLDCDADTLLIQVDLVGDAACHTGSLTCFSTYFGANE